MEGMLKPNPRGLGYHPERSFLRDGRRRGGVPRFGGALTLNVHFHAIVLHGVHVEGEDIASAVKLSSKSFKG